MSVDLHFTCWKRWDRLHGTQLGQRGSQRGPQPGDSLHAPRAAVQGYVWPALASPLWESHRQLLMCCAEGCCPWVEAIWLPHKAVRAICRTVFDSLVTGTQRLACLRDRTTPG